MFKESKWAKEILALQAEDGLWGYFHTLSEPNKHPITTEQALRRLRILGFTSEDAPIEKALSYMDDCLAGRRQTPDRREKTHDWDISTNLMLATWIRKFTDKNDRANGIARTWAAVITDAFSTGEYHHSKYIESYQNAFGIKPKGGRLVDFVSFYQVSLLANELDDRTEALVLEYILQHAPGIYYVLGNACLKVLPDDFASKQASRYLGAIELLSEYRHSAGKLQFVLDWLEENKDENGMWDMGNSVKDHIYFPLSDSWRQKADRVKDCTYRVKKVMNALLNI